MVTPESLSIVTLILTTRQIMHHAQRLCLFSVLGHEHTLPCLKMWAVVGGTTDDKKDHKAQWKHVLTVYKERGLGYSEDELERRATEVKKREDRKK